MDQNDNLEFELDDILQEFSDQPKEAPEHTDPPEMTETPEDFISLKYV